MAGANPSAPAAPGQSSVPEPAPIPETSPYSCDHFYEFTCDDYGTRTGCRCQPDNPGGQDDCEQPWHFVCDAQLDDPPPGREQDILISYAQGVGCHCTPAAFGPDECLEPHHFRCQSYYPELLDCACDESAPSPEDDFLCCHGEDWGCERCVTIR
jgi:hypothetical protein